MTSAQNPGSKRPPTPREPKRESAASTRERILSYLHEHRVASSVGLSLSWGLTREDIRYHLNELVDEGLIEPAPRDPALSPGRGRPVQYYRLSEHSSPDNFPRLCSLLLSTLMASAGDPSAALRQLAARLAEDCPPPAAAPTRRYNQAVHHLNLMQYHSRWEAHARGPQILLRNCPYAAIIAGHPELCQMDCCLIEQLTAQKAVQVARINLETGSPPACVFHLSPEVPESTKNSNL